MNYKFIAIQVGELLKYDVSYNEINRAAESVFDFEVESFPNKNITSTRAQSIYDWILTLAKQPINDDKKIDLLKKFLKLITPEDKLGKVEEILKEAGLNLSVEDEISEFYSRKFHPLIYQHCLNLYKQKNYFMQFLKL